jgi:hypothetical protein
MSSFDPGTVYMYEGGSVQDVRKCGPQHWSRFRRCNRRCAVLSHICFAVYQNGRIGITHFSDTDARSAAGHFLRVPLLVGNTAQEGDIFIVSAEQLSLGFNIPVLSQALGDAVTQVRTVSFAHYA